MASKLIIDPKIQERIKDHGLILYDGDCGFCQFWVQFVLKRDPKAYFIFAPLQAPWAKSLHGKSPSSTNFETVLLYENNRLYQKSEAALRIASRLPFPWNLATLLRAVPSFLRDKIYDAIAKRRHRFSFENFCRLPLPEERERFLGE